MSEKYRVNITDVYARRQSLPRRECGMTKVTDAVVDVAKIAVVGSVAMGLAGSLAGIAKK